MKVAIVGSRSLGNVDALRYVPEGIFEIISKRARGIDTFVEGFTDENGNSKTIIKPQYGRSAFKMKSRRRAVLIVKY